MSEPNPHTARDKPRRRPRYRGTHPRRFDERYKELNAEAHPEIVEHVRAQGRTPAGMHVPVLVAEVMAALRPAPGEVVADCTLGFGGHASAFIERIRPGGKLFGFDVDAGQLERTRQRLTADGVEISLHHRNFAGLGAVLQQRGIAGYDVIFADLGVSSMQIDDPQRGFSFKHDGPLDMRMDARTPRCAADLIASMSQAELSAALRELADEPAHESIARAIVAARSRHPITRTLELVEAIVSAMPARQRTHRDAEEKPLHPAARTFQALRMLVNDELGALRGLLRDAPYCLKPGGRIGVISFHSGEDRLVKHAFREGVRCGAYAEAADECVRASPRGRRDNPRSSPAKFRWARRATE